MTLCFPGALFLFLVLIVFPHFGAGGRGGRRKDLAETGGKSF